MGTDTLSLSSPVEELAMLNLNLCDIAHVSCQTRPLVQLILLVPPYKKIKAQKDCLACRKSHSCWGQSRSLSSPLPPSSSTKLPLQQPQRSQDKVRSHLGVSEATSDCPEKQGNAGKRNTCLSQAHQILAPWCQQTVDLSEPLGIVSLRPNCFLNHQLCISVHG